MLILTFNLTFSNIYPVNNDELNLIEFLIKLILIHARTYYLYNIL